MSKKHDQDKDPWHLLPWSTVVEVVRVFQHGAKKYSDWGWLDKSISQDAYFSAACRHLIAWKLGTDIDQESGLPHLAHAICCLLILRSREK